MLKIGFFSCTWSTNKINEKQSTCNFLETNHWCCLLVVHILKSWPYSIPFNATGYSSCDQIYFKIDIKKCFLPNIFPYLENISSISSFVMPGGTFPIKTLACKSFGSSISVLVLIVVGLSGLAECVRGRLLGGLLLDELCLEELCLEGLRLNGLLRGELLLVGLLLGGLLLGGLLLGRIRIGERLNGLRLGGLRFNGLLE